MVLSTVTYLEYSFITEITVSEIVESIFEVVLIDLVLAYLFDTFTVLVKAPCEH